MMILSGRSMGRDAPPNPLRSPLEILSGRLYERIASPNTRWNEAVFIGRKTQRSLRAVPAVPDISGGRQAYKEAAQFWVEFCRGEEDERELLEMEEVGVLLFGGGEGGEGGRP
ncbi:hypothetical protein Tco_0324833 [Tanacetum coccineum]